jgi:hypothetical protein
MCVGGNPFHINVLKTQAVSKQVSASCLSWLEATLSLLLKVSCLSDAQQPPRETHCFNWKASFIAMYAGACTVQLLATWNEWMQLLVVWNSNTSDRFYWLYVGKERNTSILTVCVAPSHWLFTSVLSALVFHCIFAWQYLSSMPGLSFSGNAHSRMHRSSWLIHAWPTLQVHTEISFD